MFEFQPCHYYEKNSQYFTYYDKSKPKNPNAKNKMKYISYDVMLNYIYFKSQAIKKCKYIY